MSFEAQDHFTQLDEDPKYEAPPDGKWADGKKVGQNPTESNVNTSEQKDVLHKPEIKPPEEVANTNVNNKKALAETADHHPDWPPATWNPEAESKLAGNMDSSFNMVT